MQTAADEFGAASWWFVKSSHAHTGSFKQTCMDTSLPSPLSLSITTSNNPIKLLCFGWVDSISISANLLWLIHSSNPDCRVCNLRWLFAIPATYHHTGINRNIFSNYKKMQPNRGLSIILICAKPLIRPTCCPTVKHRNLPLIFTRQYTQHFISPLFSGMMAEVIDLHKGRILSLGEKQRRQ